jgi:alpha-ketoglutaric semialdehyde dehydrogenase
MTVTHKNYIAGRWVDSDSGETFEDRNPADDREVIGRFQLSNRHDVDAAVAAARGAFDGWRRMPAPRRAEILFKAGALMVDRKEELARDMTREMGKVLAEARGDVQEAIDITFYMAGEGRRMFGQTTPSELPDKFNMSVRVPVGVCALVTPWNFPMAIPAWKVMPALIAGNTVVLKPATDTPLSAVNLVKILVEAGVPAGVVNLVTGRGREVGDPLVGHADVDLVSFTGSTEVGRHVAEVCAPLFRPCGLEMGGKNAIIVMDDADLDLAVEGAIWGGFGTTGQRCTAASRVLVHRDVMETFLERFVAAAKALKVGDGVEPGVDVGPLVSEAQLHTVQRYAEIGEREGILLAGGGALEGPEYAHGHYFAPTILAGTHPTSVVAQQEIFGPVVAVIPHRGLADAIEICNGVEYGLSASIYTRDVNRAYRAMRDVHTGVFYINASTIGAEVHLPFGGTKATGNGHREAGTAALELFSEWKSVYVDFSGRLQRAQIDEAAPAAG